MSDVSMSQSLGHDPDDDRQPILVISKSGEFAWEFDVNDRNGEWFAGGTASTFNTALGLALDYISIEHGYSA